MLSTLWHCSSMKHWFIYLVRTNNNALYTGITTDVERRFQEHQTDFKKGAKALRGKGPLKLVFYKKVADKSTALKVELAIKKLPKIKKEQLVVGELAFDQLLMELEL
jgi:putative endonuclease